MLINKLNNSIFCIIKYILIYILLNIIYQYYLNLFHITLNKHDPFTMFITKKAVELLNRFNIISKVGVYKYQPLWLTIISKNKITCIINEGCNIISIIISFISLIIAINFNLASILFILISIPIIVLINIIRISLLTYIYIYYYTKLIIFHNVIFPLIIYSIILILSLSWIYVIYGNNKKNN
jgi:exosortase family protein XrtF